MRRIVLFLIVSGLPLLAAACNFQQDVADVGAEVSAFHGDLDSRQFDRIYDAASEDMRAATSRKEFEELLDAVSRKLGPVKRSERVSWKVNSTTDGKFVTVSMRTEFAKGNATEQFIYRDDDGAMKLQGYNINSRALIVN